LDEFVSDNLSWANIYIPPYGANISSKDDNNFRAALQNIRGLSNSSDNVALEEIDAMATLGIDLLCMNEINIPMTLERRLQLSTALQLRFTGSRSVTSSMQTKETGYLPGGTAMITQGPTSGRVYRRGADHLGRFSWMAFRGKDGTGVLAISGYRVSQHKGVVAGENTAYMREWEMLRSNGEINPDPRFSVLEAMSEVLQEWGNRGYHPLVMMDANGELDEAQLKDFIQEHGLYDLIAQTNEGPAPRTYQGSDRRLDYMLGNKHVLSAVIRSGSMGSDEGVSYSDHTLQFVDFDRKKLFGAESTVPHATYEREFKLKDTKKKSKFIYELTRIYEHQRIPDRVKDLADSFRQRGPTNHLVQHYQDLDNEITEAMRAAAKRAGRKDYGYHRSDVLINAGREVRLWKSISSCVRSKRGYSDAVRRLAEIIEYELPEFSELTHRKARQEVTRAITAKREIHRTAAEHRALWLERLAQEAAEQKPGSDWQKVLKQMIANARQAATNKRLGAIFKPEWASLDYIEVPNEIWFLSESGDELYEFDNGIFIAHPPIDERVYEPIGVCKILPPNTTVVQVEVTKEAIYVAETCEEPTGPSWRTVDDPAEMQEWLRRRNKRHLNQMHVEQRPPTRAEFQTVLAEHGTSDVARAILDGTFDPTTLDMDEGIVTFLRGLQQREKEKSLTMPQQMTTEEFQESMKFTHEDTSSSASGLHYTLWKTIAEDKESSATHAIMISLPFMYGFVCNRWKKIIDCMLEKKAGVRKIHIMRIICLFEADFNTLLKFYFVKHVMPNAEKSGLSPDQWGGRNNRSAPACALRKLLAWEYARFTKTVLTSFLADLQSNFDCIMPDMSSIFLMKKGMPPEAAYSRAATMATLERSVRTATGTSTETYQHDPDHPSLPGEGQGKADSMAIWTLISSEILLMHGNMCQGLVMTDVTGTEISSRVDDAYVDDTDTYAMAPNTNEVDEAVDNITHNSQVWTMLVAATGGLLAFHKCMWQILFWISVAGEYLMQSDRNIKGALWLEDSRGKRHKIKRKPATEPNPGLGFLLCPTADQKFEYEKRLGQARDIAKKVSTCTLSRSDALIALKTRVIPKIGYPFGLTRFTKKQLKKIGSTINNVFLQRIGFNRKMPRVVLHAPVKFGGFDYPCMETIQDQKGISLILRQLQWDKENAKDIRIVITQAQLDSGLVQPILEDTKTSTPYLEVGLIRHLRERLNYLDGKLTVENLWCPQLQREHDTSIMQALSRLPGVTPGELKKANLCRKWMRVITLAEIASIDGTKIPATHLNGKWRAKSTLKWPRQPTPTTAMWTVFRRLMKRAFCSKNMQTLLRSDVPLDRTLGKWINATRHIEYNEYRTNKKYFKRQPEGFIRLCEKEGTNYFVDDGECNQLPLTAVPSESTTTPRNNLQPTHPYQFKMITPVEEAEVDEETREDPEHIYAAQNIIAASDSSVDPLSGEATYNWRITTYDKQGLITKSSFVNGNPLYMNSYRGEMAGLQDLVDWLHKTELRHKVIKIVCDNESCVKGLQRQNMSLTDLDKAESDLLQDIIHKLKDFPDVTVEWVRGHQDNEISYDDLPIESQLNIDCDKAAKLHLREGTKPTAGAKPIAGSKATLYLGGQIVTTELNEQIKMAGKAREVLAYAADKFGWTDNQATATINWRAIERAKKRLKLSSSIRTTKFMYGWLNVGRQKGKMGDDHICPCCGTEEEDQLHLYRCQDERMQECIAKGIATLNSKLVKEGITTPVYTAFINTICMAANRQPLSNYEIEDENATQCIESQEMLGLESILRGFHHIDWLTTLRDTWVPPMTSPDGKPQEHRKDPLEQSVSMVRGVWDLMESLWECRNNILHSNDSELIARSRDTLTARLLEFKRDSTKLLRSCDRFIIDNHSVQDVIKWPLKRKKAYADFLERLHKIYSGEIKRETASYRDIRDYFTKVTKDTAPPALSDDNTNEGTNTIPSGYTSSSISEDTSDGETPPIAPQRRLRRRLNLFESSSESSMDSTSDESLVLVQRRRLRRRRILESSSESL
jgi:hypothetical protein